MEVKVLSETQQEFGGVVYYRCGKYFQRKGKRLHRIVWTFFHGEIPEGYDVHHINSNRADNRPENLELLPGRAHNSLHSRRVSHDKAIAAAREAARAWHGTPAGFAFHSRLAKANWSGRKANTYVCTRCGKSFQTRHIYGARQNRFCSGACRAAYGAARRRKQA